MSPERELSTSEIYTEWGKFFNFDPLVGKFIVSGLPPQEEYKTSDLTDINQLAEMRFLGDEMPIKVDTPEMMAITILDSLIELPNMRKWLATLSRGDKDNLSRSVSKVMKEIYFSKVDDSIRKTVKIKDSQIQNYFRVGIDDTGKFNLQTIGSCACMHINVDYPSIYYGEYHPGLSSSNLPLEYVLHNDDYPAQRLSLFAGAGTLAFMAENDRVSI